MSNSQHGHAILGEAVYLTTLQPGTPDHKLAKNNWRTGKAGNRLDVAIGVKMPRSVLKRKLFNEYEKTQRNVWRFNEHIFLNICPHAVHVRHADGRWEPEQAGIRAGAGAGITAGLAAAAVQVPAAGIWGVLGYTTSAGATLGGPVGIAFGLGVGLLVYSTMNENRTCPFHGEEAPARGCTVKVVEALASDHDAWIGSGSCGNVCMVKPDSDVLVDFGFKGKIWVHSWDLWKLQVVEHKSRGAASNQRGTSLFEEEEQQFANKTAAVGVLSTQAQGLRKLEKKLRQINILEDKQTAGATLSAEQRDKVARKDALLAERDLLLKQDSVRATR